MQVQVQALVVMVWASTTVLEEGKKEEGTRVVYQRLCEDKQIQGGREREEWLKRYKTQLKPGIRYKRRQKSRK